jgi:hypothetical protein
MTNIESETYYKTSSIQLAAYLLARDATYIEAEQTFSNHFDFFFENPNLCEELAREFANGGKAPAQTLFEKRNFLMGEMRGLKQ